MTPRVLSASGSTRLSRRRNRCGWSWPLILEKASFSTRTGFTTETWTIEPATLAWVGPRTVREHIAPRIREAAEQAGRPAPRIIATLPVCVTTDAAAVRERIAASLSMYGELPSYRAMFEREGVGGPADLAIVGSAEEVREGIEQLRDAGVTGFSASEFVLNDYEREATRDLLRGLAA